MQELASKNAPPSILITPHFIYGGLSLLVVTLLIALFPEALTQHFFNPHLLAITHLLVLGFITTIIFGALYQLIPVILETKLYSEKLGYLTFVLLVVGSILLSLSFWHFWLNAVFHVAATFVVLSVLLFTLNVCLTSIRSSKKCIERRFIVTASIWLLFTVIVGLILGINLKTPFLSTPHLELLKLHAHAGIVGWFMFLIIGVASKLLPMFMVSHNLNVRKLHAAYYLINFGLLLTFITLFFQLNKATIFAGLLIVIGILFFLSYLYEAYKKRIKRQLDIGMKQTALSFIILLLPLILVNVLSIFKVYEFISLPSIIVYGSSLFIGFISSLILGQTYKTLPFIIWLKVYKSRIGKQKIPFPKDLYSSKIASLQLVFFLGGFVLLLFGLLIQSTMLVSLGGTLLFVAVLFYNINVLKIIFHQPINQIK